MTRPPLLIAVHPVLASGDVECTLTFFILLGFTETFRDQKNSPKYGVAIRDEVELHFQWNSLDHIAVVDRPVYRFLVNDVDELYKDFLNSGAIDSAKSDSPWKIPGDTPWGTYEFHLRDPFGNGLHFYSNR